MANSAAFMDCGEPSMATSVFLNLFSFNSLYIGKSTNKFFCKLISKVLAKRIN
jgi:hypothetical protein